MSERIPERKDTDPRWHWDLSSLYASEEAFEEDLKQVPAYLQKAVSYQGRLHTAENIHAYLEAETELERHLSNLFCYASLRQSEDTRDSRAQERYSRTMAVYVQAVSALSFAEPEILANTPEQLKQFQQDPLNADYSFVLERLIRHQPHVLSAAEENLLARFSEVLQAPGETADKLMDADLVFEPALDSQGNSHEVSQAAYILLQMSPDRTLRRNSFASLYKSYAQHIHTLTSTYDANVKEAVTEASVRHYGSSREMAMAADNLPLSVYDTLIDSVHAHMDAMYDYVRLRRQLLGVEELHYYDLYAPLVSGPQPTYTYEEAQQLILKALAPLGKDYTDVVRQAFGSGWIDVYPNLGKTGGAYSSGTYDSNPYILTNFTGTLDSVSAIAHEMGHSMHSWLANHAQQPQNADYSLFVAEVASTVNENLLIESLLEEEHEPRQRLRLLNQYLENFKGTVYRQTMFAEFEKEAHARVESGQALTSDSLNELYDGLIALYFGKDLVRDPEVRVEWARIPHFYRPFYVYVYATGYCAAVALSEAIRREGEPAARRYKEFLAMGGSAWPLEELKHAGVDLSTPAPVEAALEKFAAIVREAEELSRQL